MDKFRTFIEKINTALSFGIDPVLLAMRLLLAYSFFSPALLKLQNLPNTALWFETLGIPLPPLSAFLAGGTELLGAVLLTLGLMTRIISLPLIFTLLVAIITVHGANGFSVVQELSGVHQVFLDGVLQYETSYRYTNGFEIVLYFILMLSLLVTRGAGRISLDWLIFKK